MANDETLRSAPLPQCEAEPVTTGIEAADELAEYLTLRGIGDAGDAANIIHMLYQRGFRAAAPARCDAESVVWRETLITRLARMFPETFTPFGNRKEPNALAGNVVDAILDVAAPLSRSDAGSAEASIPTYGKIPWDQLGRDVVEAMIGTRRDFEFDPKFYPGHQSPGINFNSLARIVDKYRLSHLPVTDEAGRKK